MTEKERWLIGITINGHWSGSGVLLRTVDNAYELVECNARFSGSDQECQEVRRLIQQAVTGGKSTLRITLERQIKTIEWNLHPLD